jgi:hypothetical protein
VQAIPSNEDAYQFFTGTMDIDELDRPRELPQSPTVCQIYYFFCCKARFPLGDFFHANKQKANGIGW